jgi:exodeoxyribonuclease VII small subunit
MAANTKKFEENFKKLETLSEQLRSNEVTIDELVPRMKEALASIKVCKEVLSKTESQLEEISAEFEEIEEEDS